MFVLQIHICAVYLKILVYYEQILDYILIMDNEYSKEKRISIRVMAAFYIKSKQILRFNSKTRCVH